ncbi:Lar family restriction alleviation protein [Paenibacillus xylaniclasticus]|uniref:Lar family restriction alleviation protein n=1 Tax=Paenibacillus xylaniclasticus TaxID=588083 RepID=UPI000FD7D3B2|nr:hypothetical protein PCURB6_27420 [Paenibacillus curdlanolyticus]
MKLKPCPFCGCEPFIKRWSSSTGTSIKCRKCGCTTQIENGEYAATAVWNTRDYQSDDRISLLQYDNLRKHFKQLVDDILGRDYYNEGMDVYTCDEYCCRDIKLKLKRRWFNWK